MSAYLLHQLSQFAGHTPLERVQTLVVLHPDQARKETPSIVTASTHTNSWGVSKLSDFHAVVEHVRGKVAEILERMSNALWEREVRDESLESLYKRAEL